MLIFFSSIFKYTKDAPEDQWTKASIGITNSGGIRAGLQKGNISFADMYGVLPYGNSIDRITIKGIFLRKTLEISAGKFSPDGETEFFRILTGVLQGDTLAPYLFIMAPLGPPLFIY